jgi:hypothetical protein
LSDSSDEVVEEEAKVQKLTPSVSSASKENLLKEPIKEAPTSEQPKKAATKAKTKRRKKDTLRLELSLEQHQNAPSLNDVSMFLLSLRSTLYLSLFSSCFASASDAEFFVSWH